jgi:hypothetical protein
LWLTAFDYKYNYYQVLENIFQINGNELIGRKFSSMLVMLEIRPKHVQLLYKSSNGKESMTALKGVIIITKKTVF